MEPEGLLLCSQEPFTGLYPVPHESNPYMKSDIFYSELRHQRLFFLQSVVKRNRRKLTARGPHNKIIKERLVWNITPNLLRQADPLLRNDREIRKYTIAVAK
jgi:hypothetical protein